MHRKLLWAVLVVGLALIVTPLALSLPSKAAAGERMLGDFEPIMQPDQVATTADYYDNVFTKLRPVALAFDETAVARFQAYEEGLAGLQKEVPKLVPALALELGTTPEQVELYLARRFPATAQLFGALPQMGSDFSAVVGLMEENTAVFERVPPGLDHYLPLVRTMQGNVADYDEVSSLPSFDLFAWFFVVPGAALVLLAALGLYTDRSGTRVAARHVHPRPA